MFSLRWMFQRRQISRKPFNSFALVDTHCYLSSSHWVDITRDLLNHTFQSSNESQRQLSKRFSIQYIFYCKTYKAMYTRWPPNMRRSCLHLYVSIHQLTDTVMIRVSYFSIMFEYENVWKWMCLRANRCRHCLTF